MAPNLTMGNFAYTAVMRGDKWGLGVAVRDESGYYQTDLPTYDTVEAAEAHADILNERMGLSEKEAIRIVASSMRGVN